MKMQYLCHAHLLFVATAMIGFSGTVFISDAASAEPTGNDYPTVARVEYVNECIGKNGGKLAALYQCACAIDRIAAVMKYDEFTEATTYIRYVNLPGQAGGVFRDSPEGRKLAKNFNEVESQALHACGMASPQVR